MRSWHVGIALTLTVVAGGAVVAGGTRQMRYHVPFGRPRGIRWATGTT